ncbi:hypothetical protein EG68_10067 [Paragonimus skrjabini miyazakii]|uniref:Uncharacterized protein n=1 Tax=Paragonimus skrjabini miyazakii TaxID=59628 RepID=A0A8S9YPR8_9TREM|nr:hypothetical protein EG68_10067 [Paragonimus skrjabini miyazakii]
MSHTNEVHSSGFNDYNRLAAISLIHSDLKTESSVSLVLPRMELLAVLPTPDWLLLQSQPMLLTPIT